MKEPKAVRMLMSKKLQIIITCPECPISPNKLGGVKKTACMELNKVPVPGTNNKTLKKTKVCEYYEPDSLRKVNTSDGTLIDLILCNFL